MQNCWMKILVVHKVKGKGKGRFFNTEAILAYCILAPNMLPHSSPEAPRIIQMRDTSTSEGGNYYQITEFTEIC